MSLCVFWNRQSSLQSLEQLCSQLKDHQINICKQSLNERFNSNAVEFLKFCFRDFFKKKVSAINYKGTCIGKFSRIRINDSTSIILPEHFSSQYRGCGGGASTAGLKVQYSYNLRGEEDPVLEITNGRTPDSAWKTDPTYPNELRVADLGYFNLSNFSVIQSVKGYYLSRYRFDVKVYISKNGTLEELNLKKIISKMKTGKVIEMNVFLGIDQKLPTRLILEKVPPEVSSAKRRKLKKDKKKKREKISRERLSFCDVNAYITNTKNDMLPAKEVREIYSLRWQIELVFKSWKTIFNIDKVKKIKLERFECFFYGNLILILMLTKLTNIIKEYMWKNGKKELSNWKALVHLRDKSTELFYALLGTEKKLKLWLENISNWLITMCLKEPKKHRKTPQTIISNLGLT